MNVARCHAVAWLLAFSALGVSAVAQESGAKSRLTPAEIAAVPTTSAGTGTSGLAAVTTRILFGDPAKAGLYSIELTVAPNTVIEAHRHKDTRTAVVTRGRWLFGYGSRNDPSQLKALSAGAFYTEPAGERHFARTEAEGASVIITGYGPSDTVYDK